MWKCNRCKTDNAVLCESVIIIIVRQTVRPVIMYLLLLFFAVCAAQSNVSVCILECFRFIFDSHQLPHVFSYFLLNLKKLIDYTIFFK